MSFFSLLRQDIDQILTRHNLSTVHTKSLMKSAYKDHVENPWAAENIPYRLRPYADDFSAQSLEVTVAKESQYDHSVKFVLKLSDERLIEAVLMPESSRITLCISSQVGCRQACSFCHTGRMGLIRQLTAAEIIAQLVAANRWIKQNQDWLERCKLPAKMKTTNIVFMGMGEPLDNLEQVKKSIHIMLDHYAFGLAARRITVSTAGHLDGLKNLTQSGFKVGIAFSLHTTDPKRRSQLMPINKRYPLEEVLDFFRNWTQKSKQKILVQYTIIQGVNDSKEEALSLVKALKGIQAKLNLIPLNEVSASRFSTPTPNSIEEFAQITYKSGLQTLIRYSKGQDIDAACGQLIKKQPIA